MLRLLLTILTMLTTLGASATGYTYKAGYGMTTAWLSTDMVGIYAESSTQIRFDIQSITADSHKAYIYGHGTGLRNNTRYFSLYPYSYDYYLYDYISTALPVAYPTLTQTGNDNASHIAAVDYMAADITTTTANAATFTYAHLGAVLRLSALVPKTATFSNVTITATQGQMMTTGTLNLETRMMTPSAKSANVSLKLNNISVEKGELLTVYFILPATNLSGGDIIATFSTTSGETYSCSFSGINMQAGRLYNIGRTLRATASKGKQNDNSIAANHQSTLMAKAARANGDLYYPTCIAADFTIALNDEQYEPLPADYILGDANNDGRVNVGDLTTIAAYILGKTPAVFNKDAADANKDGRINVGDLTNIANLILKSGK